ncbi:carboxypeptidase-like regulatory domain-containing protein [Polaribacter sp. Hel_I_88]|uniref:carboxypeptidase-like regulatory domain-containing protein n=1 Tax=Polaribacter sp. Hel_I_88 TaxID=1250006 RepID=UPI00047B2AC2|nr:carboxypeptidase-like regulatory domain-containing protein [Polaribacter sp. Hel_I_88]
MKKKYLLYLTFFFLSINIFSQNKEIVFQILDEKEKKPISYATIILQELKRGTHADLDGFFKIPEKYLETISIKISAIGYTTKELKLSDFKKNAINKIFLKPFVDNLTEILIVSSKKKVNLSAKSIVKKSIENILENYPIKPHSYIGYYRDYQQPTNTKYQKTRKLGTNPKYINLNEGIVESFDQGFQTNKLMHEKNQTTLYKFKVNEDFLIDSLLKIPYDNKANKFLKDFSITPFGGNELNILNITNAIRNHDTQSFSFVDVLDKNFVENHTFYMQSTKNMNGISLYEISFKSQKEKTSFDYSANGKIFIAKNDFSIYKIDYTIFYKNDKKPQYSVLLEYLPKGDKMFLNYMMFNNLFTIKSTDYLKLEGVSYINKQNVFNLFFNKPILESSLKPISRNIKVYYKNKRLKIKSFRLGKGSQKRILLNIDRRQLIKMGILNNNITEKELNENLRFELKNIKALNGMIVNDPTTFEFYQYREFFVQEVFENKNLPIDGNFIDKILPISKATENPMNFKNEYWLNSPLKNAYKIE